MNDVIKKIADGRHISIYSGAKADVPFIYLSSFAELGPALLEECAKLETPPFALISVANLHWDEDLSPWPHEPVVSKEDHFTGEAPAYCQFLTEEVIPFAEKELGKPSDSILGGYSMGGLFALYAPYLTDAFTRLICGSGSVWYPGFVEYVKSHAFLHRPQSIYLSLGDRETHTRNQYLQGTQTTMEELAAYYTAEGIDTTFELNPGGHHDHYALRMAKGIHWTLSQTPM